MLRFAVVLVAATPLVGRSSNGKADANAAERIREIERTRPRALVEAGMTVARPRFADDFQLINPAGEALSREEYLGGGAAGDIDLLAIELASPIQVRLSGKAAAVRYRWNVDIVVAGLGRLTHQAWTTALHEQRRGRWQVDVERPSLTAAGGGSFRGPSAGTTGNATILILHQRYVRLLYGRYAASHPNELVRHPVRPRGGHSMAPFYWIVVWLILVALRLRSLTHDCYDHVQEVIRADAHAGQRTIHAKERFARLGDRTGSLYQPTAVSPVSPFRHVRLLPSLPFVVWPTRRFVRGAVIHWTPLVRYPTAEWLEDLTDAVAHFLGLRPDQVELADTNISRKRARVVRTSA